jgi:2-oxoglutarate ferredoxin oxidoreductase subunit alpha
MRAFNIAEEYQMPVIILSDQFLGHRKETVGGFDLRRVKVVSRRTPAGPVRGEYKRFEMTSDGISPMSYPGIAGGEYTCVGIEHDEFGHPASGHTMHEKMSAKRERKLEALVKDYGFIRRYGAKKPDIGILAWGSTKGAVREAVEAAEEKGIKAGALIPQLLYPLQAGIVAEFISACKRLVVVEMSHSGQFKNYISSHCRLPKDVVHIRSSGARLFEADEILNAIRSSSL